MVLGLVVFGYGMVGSYVTVSELAARRGVPLAAFVSAGIDGGLPMRNVIWNGASRGSGTDRGALCRHSRLKPPGD
ncbi:MAG: hypothetical protein ACRDQ4_16410 [Pseudonocardiaceae bacterium]